MAQGFNSDKFEMSYSEIAKQLSKDEGIEYTENQVKLIANRALAKLRNDEKVRSFIDFLRDSDTTS